MKTKTISELSILDDNRKVLMQTYVHRRSIFRIRKYRASMFDKNGNHLHTVVFSPTDHTFNYRDGTYNVIVDKGAHTRRQTLFHVYHDFFYVVGNPNPLKVDGSGFSPVIDARAYKVILDSKIIRELNDLSDNWLAKLFTPRNIIIALVLIAAGYYFFSGGKLT